MSLKAKPQSSKPDASPAPLLKQIREQVDRIGASAAQPLEKIASLELAQIQTMRVLREHPATCDGLGVPHVPADTDGRNLLHRWARCVEVLEARFPHEIPHLGDIAQNANVGPDGNRVYEVPFERFTCWIHHARAVLDVLVRHTEGDAPTAAPASILPDPIAAAQGLRAQHPGKEWSDAKIAKAVGIHPSTLCRNADYKKLKAMVQAKEPPPHGVKDAEGDIEAWGE